MAAALALFLIVGGGLRRPERLRGTAQEVISIVAPEGEVDAVRELVWKPVRTASSYRVRLLDEHLDVLWEGRPASAEAALPAELSESLLAGESYYWQVETQDAEGVHWKSRLTRLTLRE